MVIIYRLEGWRYRDGEAREKDPDCFALLKPAIHRDKYMETALVIYNVSLRNETTTATSFKLKKFNIKIKIEKNKQFLL